MADNKKNKNTEQDSIEQDVNVELFEEGSFITLFDDDNNELKFEEIASVELDGKFYEILLHVGELEGLEEDEAVIFEYQLSENGEEGNFAPVLEEDLLNKIFEEYLKAVQDESEEGCGGSCSSCGGGCNCE